MKDWLAELLFDRVMDVRELAPTWVKDHVGDGGLVALFLVGAIAVLCFVGKTALDPAKEKVKPWLQQGHRVWFVLSYLAALLVGFLTGRTWMEITVAVLALATLFGPPPLRPWLSGRPGIVLQLVLVLGVFLGQDYRESVRNAQQHYYVFLAFDRRTISTNEGADETIERLSGEYLLTHRAIFRGLSTVQIVPQDLTVLKKLPSHEGASAAVAREVMRLLGRRRFCPALVVAATADLERDPTLRVRVILRGIPPDASDLRPTGAAIDLEGRVSDIRYLALRSAASLLGQLRALQCDKELISVAGSGPAAAVPMALASADEESVRRRLLDSYREWLASGPAHTQALLPEVTRVLKEGRTDDKTLRRLLGLYRPAPRNAGPVNARRCADLAKLNIPC